MYYIVLDDDDDNDDNDDNDDKVDEDDEKQDPPRCRSWSPPCHHLLNLDVVPAGMNTFFQVFGVAMGCDGMAWDGVE